MATLWMDPFEDYGATTTQMLDGLYDHAGSGWTISATNPGTGSRSLRFISPGSGAGRDAEDGTGVFRRNFGGLKTTVGFGYRFFFPGQPATETVTFAGACYMLGALVTGSNNTQIMFVLGTDGAVVAYRGRINAGSTNASVLLGRSDPALIPGQYNHFEVRAVCHNSTGAVECRVNGVAVLNLTGIDTQSQGSADFSGVVIGQHANDPVLGTCYLDDFHAWDDVVADNVTTHGLSDFGGNLAVFRTPVTSDVSNTDWTITGDTVGAEACSDGSDGTYVGTNTVGARIIMRAESLPVNVSSIVCKQINLRALKDSSGDASLTPALRNGSAETPIDEIALGTAATWHVGQVGYNPTTAAPWEPTDVTDLVLERTL